MIHWYDAPILTVAAFAFVFSANIPRAWRWLALGGASLAISRVYWSLGGVHPAFVTSMCDAAVCIAIDRWAREEWELKLYRVFQAQVLVSLIFHVGIGTQYVYALSLEALNWTALGIIGGTSAMDWMRRHGSFFGSRWRDRVSDAVSRLRAARRSGSWWEATG